jgi:hypothetical protein
MKFYERLFKLLTWSWYILFGLAYTNYWPESVGLLEKVTFYYKIFVSAILIWFFNPLHKTELTETHKSIVFTAGTFILFSTGLMTVLDHVADDTKKAVSITGNTIKNVISS